MNNITFDIDAPPQDLRDQLREAIAPTQEWPQIGNKFGLINAHGEIHYDVFTKKDDDDRELLAKGVIYHPKDAPFAAKAHQAQNRLDIAVMNRGDRNAFVEGRRNWVVRLDADKSLHAVDMSWLRNPDAITVRTEALAEYMIANHAADIVTVITKGRE